VIEIVVAGEPVGKGRPRFSRKSGTAFTPSKTIHYEERVALAAQAVMNGRPLMTGPIELQVGIYLSIPASKSRKWKADALAGLIFPTKKPDWDNVSKMTDALNCVVFVDDSQIVDAIVKKRYSDLPRLELKIRGISIGLFG
jgi:Holliday junction resolvase RusA-like endonuclease